MISLYRSPSPPPSSARITRLGTGLGLAQTPDVPGYADLTASVCAAVARAREALGGVS